ncbi:MAG: hypothetical protein ACJAWL_000943 [Motiliproteus sp.]|jgi:hypothetical protein
MPVTFELTEDPRLLAQYYRIREACFRQDLGLTGFDGSEDADDRHGHIMIARDGDRCVGGARINGTGPGHSRRLPMETDDFLMGEVMGEVMGEMMPALTLDNRTYCQWTRLCLTPDYRIRQILRGLVQAVIVRSAALGYRYAFNVAGMSRARLYKRLHEVLGYRYDICEQLLVPVEEGFRHLQHLLSITHLDAALHEGKAEGKDDCNVVCAGLEWHQAA